LPTYFWTWTDDVPLLGARRTPFVAGCARTPRRNLCARDQPTEACVHPTSREGRRLPSDQVLSTAATTGSTKGSLLPPSCVGLSLTPPTRFPPSGERCLLRALQALPREHPHARASREHAPFATSGFGDSRLGLTTQARLLARSVWPVARADCPRSSHTGRSASTASTTESSSLDYYRFGSRASWPAIPPKGSVPTNSGG
jgi:hypothetical protein